MTKRNALERFQQSFIDDTDSSFPIRFPVEKQLETKRRPNANDDPARMQRAYALKHNLAL